MPWWAWALGVPAAIVALAWLARRSFRASVRREAIEELRAAYEDLQVLEQNDARLVVKSKAVGEVQINLPNLYVQCARAGGAPEARSAALRRFLSGLHRQAAEIGVLDLDRHGSRLLPRLVPAAFVAHAPPPALPHRALGDTGLVVAYVLDQPTSVAYIHTGQLKELRLDEGGLHERTLANLAPSLPGACVEDALAGKVVALKSGDSHDATRLLLVPARLREGQELAALVPDSDTLLLLKCPADGNWKALARMAKPGTGKAVLPGIPLRVTSAGIRRAPGF